jgi:phenylacetate-CoA ligase
MIFDTQLVRVQGFNFQRISDSMMHHSNYPEDLSRAGLEARQSEKLQLLLQTVIPANPFWTQKYSVAGVDIASIKSVHDLHKLPLTTKQELVLDQDQAPPYGTNLSYPLEDFKRCHQTSGTTGRPMSWLDTEESWNWFKECWEQSFRIAGVGTDERLMFPFSFGPFVGFWAAFEGACVRGNFVVAAGGMSSEARLEMIARHRPTVLCCTPTYAMRLAEVAQQNQIPIEHSSVKTIIVAGEPGGSVPATRYKLESAWGARVIDHWGMTDIGPLAIESETDPGHLLVLESECIAEVIEPQTGKQVAVGSVGELVITNLGRYGMPVIRYRTGDLVRVTMGMNPCGRALKKLEGGVLGRVDDMITIRGNNLFPSSLESLIREHPEINEFRVTIDARQTLHQLRIELEPVTISPESQSCLKKIEKAVKDRMNFHAEILLVQPGTLPRFEMKAKRFQRLT